MARPIWSGSISFGLVNVPVSLVTVIRDRSVQLHMVNREGDCRLRRKLYCPETGEEYDFKDTARGYEIAPDQYVIIEQDELDRLRPESGRALEITEFVDLGAIDPMFFDRTYLLLPADAGANGYRLLVEAMTSMSKAAIARFVMRQRQYLAAIRPLDDALLLQTLHYGDEVEDLAELPEIPRQIKTVKKEVQIAERLIEALSTEFDPSKYHDEYRDRLRQMIDAKAEGEGVVIPTYDDEELPPTYSIADALSQSLKLAKGSSTKGRLPAGSSAAEKSLERTQAASAPRKRTARSGARITAPRSGSAKEGAGTRSKPASKTGRKSTTKKASSRTVRPKRKSA